MFLSVVHLRELRCAQCSCPLGAAGARSFVVDAGGSPVAFDPSDPPAEMNLEIVCPQRHVTTLLVPNEISAEQTLETPEDAPCGIDAVLVSGATESGKAL